MSRARVSAFWASRVSRTIRIPTVSKYRWYLNVKGNESRRGRKGRKGRRGEGKDRCRPGFQTRLIGGSSKSVAFRVPCARLRRHEDTFFLAACPVDHDAAGG